MPEVYGPPNPPIEKEYQDVPDRAPLRGQANKVIYDLNRLLKIYSGIQARIFQYNNTGTTRCTVCTDVFTGERVLSNCETCMGTGVIPGYISLGDFWIGINFTPNVNIATDTGNTVTGGSKDDYICIVGCPAQLKDRDVIILKHTKEVYRVVEREPEIVGLGGIMIMQIISAPFIENGHIAYKLIDW